MAAKKNDKVTSVVAAEELATGKICVITKNGNFFAAVSSKTKAVAELRKRVTADLGLDVSNTPSSEKADVIRLAGVEYWRAKIVDLA